MKHLKTLALAAVAVGALVALIGVGTASASVLCSTTTTPCNSKWPKGTVLSYSLVKGTTEKFATTPGESFDTCSESTDEGAVVVEGTETESEEESTTSLTFSGCTFVTKTVQACPFRVDSIAKSDNGTVTVAGNGCDLTINTVLFGSCTFGAPAGTDVGTLTATTVNRTDAIRDINAVLNITPGEPVGCPKSIKWTAEFTLTKPANTDLYVEPN